MSTLNPDIQTLSPTYGVMAEVITELDTYHSEITSIPAFLTSGGFKYTTKYILNFCDKFYGVEGSESGYNGLINAGNIATEWENLRAKTLKNIFQSLSDTDTQVQTIGKSILAILNKSQSSKGALDSQDRSSVLKDLSMLIGIFQQEIDDIKQLNASFQKLEDDFMNNQKALGNAIEVLGKLTPMVKSMDKNSQQRYRLKVDNSS